MANRTSYELHHHFPKLAEESGFTFNVHRSRSHVDWHKIRSMDIESIMKERKFHLIEHHLNDIFNCVLESEFDVRILDEGVVKMFRLAQLTVEYQQFCRHYLDRSVYVLREEITALAQELDSTKKNLIAKEEELRKFKRKTKHTCRTPLTFGNDNIATMILKTLSNKSEIFGNPSTSNADVIQYNKCNYCDKVFLNQLYLKSHVSRRHSNMLDVPQKDVTDNEKDNSKFNDEIGLLKDKLKEMENLLLKVNNEKNIGTSPSEEVPNNKNIEKIIMRDAEVSTDTEYNILDKFEEWKKDEYNRYNKEISFLRSQIVDIVNSIKSKEKPVQNDSNLIEQLHTTIQQQGKEILALKQELTNTRLGTRKEEDKNKEVEAQMAYWAKRVEAQTKQYDLMVQKLNDVAQEAKEARMQADSERSRASELQQLLKESLTTKNNEHIPKHNFDEHFVTNGDMKRKVVKRKIQKSKQGANSETLESLHRKAQELLNMKSSSSSDMSSSSRKNSNPREKTTSKAVYTVKTALNETGSNLKQSKAANNRVKSKQLYKDKPDKQNENIEVRESKTPKIRKEMLKSKTNIERKVGNGSVVIPGSPVKLVRAKITEEVNSRLVNMGVDPLKNRLPKSYYRKQKMQLQQQNESKAKNTPEYQKIRHSILAYLDSNALPVKNSTVPKIDYSQEYTSPNRLLKTFSLSSVISNVRNKALSLVKSNDATTTKNRRKAINAEVAKKAMALLKTPPSSENSSPVKQKKVDDMKLSTKEKDIPLPKKRGLQRSTHQERLIDVKKKLQNKSAENESSESDHKYYDSEITSQGAKSIEILIKSPARRPSSANAMDYNGGIRKLEAENIEKSFLRSQSTSNILQYKADSSSNVNASLSDENSSDELAPLEKSSPFKKATSDENISKQTKGVLKNASSTSSLNKKKVLFDMDAIQMKSVSASPSQSITEKSDNNEKFELGLVNLDGEEWDISSIENEPLQENTKIQLKPRTSPKIAELKQSIESQLARRAETPSTAIVGGVNLMPAATIRNSSIAGSNTSLGSSILDESDGIPNVTNKAVIKANIIEKDDSEIDMSEYSMDDILHKKRIDSF